VVNKDHEQAAIKLASLYAKKGDAASIAALVPALRPWFVGIPKVRTAKIVKHLVKELDSIESAKAVELAVVEEAIVWAEKEGMNVLRQSLATQLAALLFANEKYVQALDQLSKILREVKRLDDKQLQVDIQLLESRVQHALHNTPKARAALTAARTAANSIYCPPLTQALIDMQAGVLHAEEKDYKTAYSYFYESFEGYSLQESPLALRALKYMLLCKIMVGATDDISQILTHKAAVRYSGRDIDAMRAVAAAYKERSLKAFADVQKAYPVEIGGDVVVHAHLAELYSKLLESNLLRIIEPYSCVEISHVARLIALPLEGVERKLSQMILDKRFSGVLDAANGCLHVWEDVPEEASFTATLETIGQMNKGMKTFFKVVFFVSYLFICFFCLSSRVQLVSQLFWVELKNILI
jgi:26S proteasome regulatory subunit N6